MLAEMYNITMKKPAVDTKVRTRYSKRKTVKLEVSQ
jgi:hypothetical protein